MEEGKKLCVWFLNSPLFCPLSDLLPLTALILSENFSTIKNRAPKAVWSRRIPPPCTALKHTGFPLLFPRNVFLTQDKNWQSWNFTYNLGSLALRRFLESFTWFGGLDLGLEKLPRTCLKALDLAQRTDTQAPRPPHE